MDGPRLPRREELDDLARLMHRSFGGGEWPPSPDRARRRARRRVPRESRIIAEDGKPVSHIRVAYSTVSLYGCQVKIAGIGGVCTDPDYRGRGIASVLLRHCAEEARGAGATLLVISGDRDLYRRAQAAPVGATLTARLDDGAVGGLRGDVEARPARPEDWAACAALYGAEPVRFVRPAGFFAGAFRARSGRRSMWVIESEGEVAAYMLLGRIWGLPADDRVKAVSEYGGSRAALVRGLHGVLEGAELREMELGVPAHDRSLVDLLAGSVIELRRRTLRSHTAVLLDVPRLMRRLRPYVRARLERADTRRLSFEQSDGVCAVRFGEERLEYTLADMVGLVFGWTGAPAASGELGRVLSALFPAPFPMPGLNYV